jgi:hypothetical protein
MKAMLVDDQNITVQAPAVVVTKWRRFKHSFEVLQWREARVPYVHRANDPATLKIYPGGMPRGWNPLYSPNLIKIGLPDVVTPFYDDFMPFSRAWQIFHFDLMKLSAGGAMTENELKAAFIPIFDRGRFLTNNHSWDNRSSSTYPYHDYINARHVAAPDPQFEALGMGGNVVKELDRVSYGGEWWVVVECLYGGAGSMPPVGMTWKTHPHLIYHAVNETLINGMNAVTEFPQLKGAPVYYAFASKQKQGDRAIQWVRESWLTPA